MLIYKASQIVAIQPITEKPYSIPARNGSPATSGTSVFTEVTCTSSNGTVAVIRLKAAQHPDMAKRHEEIKNKVARLTIGKPAEIEIKSMEEGARGVLVLNA